MRHFASFALVLALLRPLAAQAADAPRSLGGNPPLPAPGTSRLPLDAMLHHQPRAGDVARREEERGDDEQAQKRRQAELDALYNDIMARSAPKK
ncbi:MAG TPA: hypothetical protein VGU20_03845 [Stellaceae bacterium]|nr:hypothetical protein [Stellaceae bacterium]